MAGLPQGTQQLGFGVKQGLSPLGVPGSHGQDSPLQREGRQWGASRSPAMVGQSCQSAARLPSLVATPGEDGPGRPAVAMPVLVGLVAATQRRGAGAVARPVQWPSDQAKR